MQEPIYEYRVAVVALSVISAMLALSGGFIFALEFNRQYQDSNYQLLGSVLVLLAVLVALPPVAGNSAHVEGASRLQLISALGALVVVVPALAGAGIAVVVG